MIKGYTVTDSSPGEDRSELERELNDRLVGEKVLITGYIEAVGEDQPGGISIVVGRDTDDEFRVFVLSVTEWVELA